jgi:predicted Rossmann-fold nucleotide-binding protein
MFDPPQALYATDELLAGFDEQDDRAFALTYDFSVFRAFVANGGAVPRTLSVRHTQAEHDASIGDGLRRFLKAQQKSLVGVMGGHSVPRDHDAYRDIAKLTRHLGKTYLIVTGGGPGIMEAAHFGVAFSNSSDARFDAALTRLSDTPRFPNLDTLLTDDGEIAPNTDKLLKQATDWVRAALDARRMVEGSMPTSLAIPTWRYGAEPTMPFATHYAKYFQNSIREESLVNNSQAGIIFGRGGGGTLREVFQDVELNYYAKKPKDVTPMVFFDPYENFWGREPDIQNAHVNRDAIKLDEVIVDILRTARYKIDQDDQKVTESLAKIYFGADYGRIDTILAGHAPVAALNLAYALNAQPLKVTTSRISRA